MTNGSELLMVTIVGIGVVFAALVLLALIIVGFKYLFYKETKDEGVKEQVYETTEINEEDGSNEKQEELVAVIAAAIACANPETRFVVKNIRWASDPFPEWRRIAKQEQINTMTGR